MANYKESLAYLETLQPNTFRMELGPIMEALDLFGNPDNSFASIHIAGTNGKGSTAAFIASIMKKSGYRTGLFTSPHLIDVRERIQIDRKMISQSEFAELVRFVREGLIDDRMLSYFEFMCVAAFIYFKVKKVKVAVIETGLGGRLDATNVITPKVAVITSIAKDHTLHLGNTIKDIAREKCGIIKRAIPTVVAQQPPEAMDVIRRSCDDVGSPLCLADPSEITVPLGLVGEHQRQNAACAVEACNLMEQSGFKIKGVSKALLETVWMGRLDRVKGSPRVILDGAHNASGAETLASYVRNNIVREDAVLVLGIMADKDLAGIVRPLAPLFREVICVKAPSPRAASPKDIAAAVRSSGSEVSVGADAPQAIAKVMKRLKKKDTLVISGSLTMVGEAMSFFKKGRSKAK